LNALLSFWLSTDFVIFGAALFVLDLNGLGTLLEDLLEDVFPISTVVDFDFWFLVWVVFGKLLETHFEG